MKTQLLLITLATFSLASQAQNVTIPDANFKAYLVGNSAINTNGDAEIQVSEAAAFTGIISCNSMNITDLTGLEEFINITGLHACCNQITNVDVSMMPNLTQIWISVNQLTSANVANGNNTNFNFYWFDTNPNLHCIQVDDASYSNANWGSSINSHQSFNEDCATTVGVEKYLSSNSISVFPNPAQGFVTISELAIGSELSVLDITGKVIFSTTVSANILTINTEDFTNGLYLIHLNHSGATSTKKLIVNK
jgi:hypothetical protein